MHEEIVQQLKRVFSVITANPGYTVTVSEIKNPSQPPSIGIQLTVAQGDAIAKAKAIVKLLTDYFQLPPDKISLRGSKSGANSCYIIIGPMQNKLAMLSEQQEAELRSALSYELLSATMTQIQKGSSATQPTKSTISSLDNITQAASGEETRFMLMVHRVFEMLQPYAGEVMKSGEITVAQGNVKQEFLLARGCKIVANFCSLNTKLDGNITATSPTSNQTGLSKIQIIYSKTDLNKTILDAINIFLATPFGVMRGVEYFDISLTEICLEICPFVLPEPVSGCPTQPPHGSQTNVEETEIQEITRNFAELADENKLWNKFLQILADKHRDLSDKVMKLYKSMLSECSHQSISELSSADSRNSRLKIAFYTGDTPSKLQHANKTAVTERKAIAGILSEQTSITATTTTTTTTTTATAATTSSTPASIPSTTKGKQDDKPISAPPTTKGKQEDKPISAHSTTKGKQEDKHSGDSADKPQTCSMQ